MAAKQRVRRNFEGHDCWKCDGTGYVRGFAHVMGGVCFRCGGVGWQLSKRGAVAFQMFADSLPRKRADELEPGDRIFVPGAPGIVAGGWRTIATVERDQPTSAWTHGQERPTDHITWESAKGYRTTCPPDETYRVAQPREAYDALLQAAVEFQATLTKQGQPRKRKVAA